MSVINKMLQDLEQRQQSEASADKAPTSQFIRPQVAFNSQVEQPKKSPLRVLILVLMLPMTWFGYSLLQQGEMLDDKAEFAPEISTKNANQSEQSLISSTVSPVVKADTQQDEEINLKLGMSDEQLTPLALSAEQGNALEPDSIAAEIPHEKNIESQSAKTIMVKQNDLPSQVILSSEPVAQPDITNVVASSDNVSVAAITPENEAATVASSTQPNSTVQVQSPQSSQPQSPQQGANNRPASQQAVASNMKVTEVTLTKAQLAKVLFQKAQVAEKEKRLSDASSGYLEAIILDPSLHSARKQLVGIYYAQNNVNTAIRLLESGVGMFPSHWEFYLIKANIENALQEYSTALQSLSYIDDNSGYVKDKWVFQGEVAQKVAQYSLAESAYRSLLTLESTQAKWWMGLAYALDSQQQYAKAAEAYRSALNYPGLSNTAIEFVEQRLAQLGENQ
ncbi:tetratricopeptide repeat protein [Shewanella sp. OMA3-2]|uniref:tetratricopeptide repeat protein n=1 Tax=Shewanella sp. OMA3-2 TaxID=2908650 RepID=UPI001F34FFBA|nr:tetratricopeptide repeat protein [Shewanella sp. OMA3-2]UJF21986.1 tetratricopeptide repeat protein [Shewanella sp. OMA3-2]